MRSTAFFKMYDALADYLDYFPIDKKLLFSIPDTILYEDATPIHWFSTRGHYTGHEKQKIFRHGQKDLFPSVIYKALTNGAESEIIASMIFYEENTLSIKHLDRYELRDILFVYNPEVPKHWLLQRFIVPDHKTQTIVSDGRSASLYINRHAFHKYSKIHEACYTVETKDKSHVERGKLLKQTTDNIIAVTEVARLCLSKFSPGIKRNKELTFYLKPDKAGKLWLLWCFIPFNMPVVEVVDVSKLIENIVPFSDPHRQGGVEEDFFLSQFGSVLDDDDDDDGEDEEEDEEEEVGMEFTWNSL